MDYQIVSIRRLGIKVFCLIKTKNSLGWSYWNNVSEGTSTAEVRRQATEFYDQNPTYRNIFIDRDSNYFRKELAYLGSPQRALREVKRKRRWAKENRTITIRLK